MSPTIWKSVITDPDQEILIPEGAEFLCAREQSDQICVWYKCDNTLGLPSEVRRIVVYGTGHPAPESVNGKYLGSAQIGGGILVFHIFEVAVK